MAWNFITVFDSNEDVQNVAGSEFTEGADTLFMPFSGLVYGPQGGPFTHVDSGTPLPVTIISGGGTLPAGAATSANQTTEIGHLSAIQTAIQILDNAVSGNEFQVDVLTMPTTAVSQSGTWNLTNISGTISLPTGAATSALQSTGNTSLGTIAGAVAGSEMQVDVVTSALPTGAATSALQGTGNTSLATLAGAVSGSEMQVDVITSALPSGAATSANQSTAITALQLIDDVVHSGDAAASKYALIGAVFDDASTGTVTENQAQSLRMSSRRALLVEGVASGTAIGVSGTVAATQSGAWTVTQSGTWTVGLSAGTNNIGDVDVLTLPALPAGNNNIGDVDIASFVAGAILEVQGDVARDAVAAGNPVLMGGRASLAAPTAVSSDGDAVDNWLDRVGRANVKITAPTCTPANVTAATSSTQLLAANTSRVYCTLFNDSAAYCYVNIGAAASSTAFIHKMEPYELFTIPGATQVINGLWTSATGAMRVGDFT